ncbi:DUF2860 family protein [Desulfobacula phenolica]|uniref:DUF2860 domain-containing protein n=1 Tax=Desulfobacula phenolica TaxID=90732 RepID=A0A1H2E3Y9_9BACT|nr:DUF2860 family protein [Desulfobacula phenolica]SDT89734.1 Protein of unknown function [Desulfobacula phenolica]
MNKVILLAASCSCVLFLLSLFFVNAYAGAPPEGGFSGYLFLGGAYGKKDMSLNDASDSENSTINSLTQSSKSISEFSPFFGGSLNYTFAQTGTTLGLGGDDGAGAFISQYMGNFGTISLGMNYSQEDVWEDPFLLGVKRKETDIETIGYFLTWEQIMDTSFSLSYGFQTIDIDKDLSGKRDKRLKRDGDIHTLNIGCNFFENEAHEISAGLTYDYADLTGSSSAYKGMGLEFSHMLKGDDWEIETGISFLKRDYDKSHPEFSKIREDKEFEIESAYTLFNPLGFNDFFVTISASYSINDSNIKFYESSELSSGLGFGYIF